VVPLRKVEGWPTCGTAQVAFVGMLALSKEF